MSITRTVIPDTRRAELGTCQVSMRDRAHTYTHVYSAHRACSVLPDTWRMDRGTCVSVTRAWTVHHARVLSVAHQWPMDRGSRAVCIVTRTTHHGMSITSAGVSIHWSVLRDARTTRLCPCMTAVQSCTLYKYVHTLCPSHKVLDTRNTCHAPALYIALHAPIPRCTIRLIIR